MDFITLFLKLIVSLAFTSFVHSELCLFDFEEGTELDDFDDHCDGQVGKWSIKETPSDGANRPSDVGEQVLTNIPGEMGCMRTTKNITMGTTFKFTILFYVKKTDYSGLTLNIYIRSTSSVVEEPVEWKVVTDTDYELQNNGLWVELQHEFLLPKEDQYKVEIRLFSGSKNVEIDIDKITLDDLPGSDDECYVVPRTTTTESTTESTTTESTTTESTTTESTTTESTTTESTTTESTTTESTTTESTTTESTTTESTTTESTTTESTTTESTASESTTTESTTAESTSTESTTTESTTKKSPTESTTTENTPTDSTTESATTDDGTTERTSETTDEGATTESTTSATSDGSFTGAQSSAETTNTPFTTLPPNLGAPSFSQFYWVTIIASSGGFAILSALVCCGVMMYGRRRNKKDREKHEHFF